MWLLAIPLEFPLTKKKTNQIFLFVINQANRETKQLLFKLRHTWGKIFSSSILYDLDVCVKRFDSSWPVIKLEVPSPINSRSTITELQVKLEQRQQIMLEIAKTKQRLLLWNAANSDGKKRLSEGAAIEEPFSKAIKLEQIYRLVLRDKILPPQRNNNENVLLYSPFGVEDIDMRIKPMNHVKPTYAEPSISGYKTKKEHGKPINTSFKPKNRVADKTDISRWQKPCQPVLPMQANTTSVRPSKSFASNAPSIAIEKAHPLPLMQFNRPPPSMSAVSTAPALDINELYQKLSAAGILDSMKQILKAEEEKPALHLPQSLKKRQTNIISALYSGTQCSSCGQRFPPDQTTKFNEHLDWHYQQNRTERNLERRQNSHQWYNKLDDWMQCGETEKAKENEKCFFEVQRSIDESNRAGSASPQVPSCVAAANEHNRACDVCNDMFDIFFDEDSEDWHLRNAIRIDEAVFHPDCYGDYLKNFE